MDRMICSKSAGDGHVYAERVIIDGDPYRFCAQCIGKELLPHVIITYPIASDLVPFVYFIDPISKRTTCAFTVERFSDIYRIAECLARNEQEDESSFFKGGWGLAHRTNKDRLLDTYHNMIPLIRSSALGHLSSPMAISPISWFIIQHSWSDRIEQVYRIATTSQSRVYESTDIRAEFAIRSMLSNNIGSAFDIPETSEVMQLEATIITILGEVQFELLQFVTVILSYTDIRFEYPTDRSAPITARPTDLATLLEHHPNTRVKRRIRELTIAKETNNYTAKDEHDFIQTKGYVDQLVGNWKRHCKEENDQRIAKLLTENGIVIPPVPPPT